MKRRLVLVGTFTLIVATLLPFPSLYSLFMRPDLMKTPVDRLIGNISKQLESEPENAVLHLNLARVHAMAYAQKTDQVDVEKRKPNEVFFGHLALHAPFGKVVELDDEFRRKNQLDDRAIEDLKSAAANHLDLAIASYRRTLELDPQNVTAELGLAWALDQKGEDESAVALYRKLVADAWDKEKDMTFANLKFRSVVAEAAGYLIAQLDAADDKDEIADLQGKIDRVSKIRRPVTPIAIPLKRPDWSHVYDSEASVRFDADGSGVPKHWTWIHRDAGWLVYDHTGDGKISSALQMFGSVSFWCFWENGYNALRCLDDDGDGFLRGEELDRLAIWQDANQNGISELGEVRPVVAHRIAGIDCSYRPVSVGGATILGNPNGIIRRDGSTAPSYDVILQPAHDRHENRLQSSGS